MLGSFKLAAQNAFPPENISNSSMVTSRSSSICLTGGITWAQTVNLIWPLFLGKQREMVGSFVVTATPSFYCKILLILKKKPTLWGMKFPMLGITPGINFKASRQNIFLKWPNR